VLIRFPILGIKSAKLTDNWLVKWKKADLNLRK